MSKYIAEQKQEVNLRNFRAFEKKVSHGTFYNHIFRNKRDNTWYSKCREEFRIKIQQIYDDNNQIFGAAKITAIMKEEGYRISIGMVRELMHDMGLISISQDAKD